MTVHSTAETVTSRTSFADGWTFRRGAAGTETAVRLPHDAMIGEPRSADAGTGNHGGYFPGGRYVYTKVWTVPEDIADRDARLLFEGVYGATVVRANGQEVGRWHSGYREVTVPLGSGLIPGEDVLIEVDVDNTRTPNSRWYTGSGIYRPVWLVRTPHTFLAHDGVHVVTSHVGNEALVHVSVTALDELSGDARVEVQLVDGRESAAIGTAVIADGTAIVALTVPRPRLWSAETPHLYDIVVTVVDGDEVVDTRKERVGLRTVEVDPRQGLRINGSRVLLRGACVHHDNGILGAATHAAAERRRARILKENGFNAVRSSHNPLSRAFLDACDEIGLYVMDELTDTWFQAKTTHDDSQRFDEDWRQDLESMIAKDRNRPSVIMYSVGNEVAETATPRGIETTAALVEAVTSLDPTRPTTVAMNFLLNVMASFGTSPFRPDTHEKARSEKKPKTAATSTAANVVAAKIGPIMQQIARLPRADRFTRRALAAVDVAGYNYAYLRYAADRKRYPDRVILGSESMPGDIAKIWALVESVPGVIGDFMWTGWDYLGEAGIGTWSYGDGSGIAKAYPELLAGSGAIDILGIPGAPALLARAVWDELDAPAIAVRPLDRAGERAVKTPWRSSDAVTSWAWTGYDGTTAEIEVYSADDEVELLLNGRSLGRKPAGKRNAYVATFSTQYRPGRLTAIGYRADVEHGRSHLYSASASTLRLRVEQNDPGADDGRFFVWVEIADEHGTVDSAAYDEVTMTIDGDAALEGFGNAAPATTGSYADSVHDTWYGRALSVIRSDAPAGSVVVSARSRRFGFAEIVL